ncbi:MAG: hypothetical protein IIC94_00675 [Chloroflexi bacterium]|nr:hypothetical protein [Chloroflexota bacterium]
MVRRTTARNGPGRAIRDTLRRGALWGDTTLILLSHRPRLALALLAGLIPAAAACGGSAPGGIERFTGERITVEASADIHIVASAVSRVASVRPVPDGLAVPRGGIIVFTAVAEDSAGRFLADVDFRWRMRDPLAGTVSDRGLFTAGSVPGVYTGVVEVTAVQRTDAGEFVATGVASVVVTSGFIDISIVSVTIFPSTATVRPGERVAMRPGALGNFGGLVQDLALVWRVTDPAVGEIDQNGILTAGSTPGFYEDVVQVQARRLTGSAPPVIGTASVRILSLEEARGGVRAVVGPSVVVGRPGERFPLVLFAFDFQGRSVPLGDVRWQVRDPDVGVVDRDRLILGDTPGQYPASVRATATLGGAYEGRAVSADLDVLVQRPLAQALGVPGDAQVVPEVIRLGHGARARVSLLYFDADGVAVTTGDVEWRFDDDIVTVDARGRVSAVGPPGVYPGAISAIAPAFDGEPQMASATVIVLGPMVRAEIVPGVVSLDVDGLAQFAALAFDAADNRLFDVQFAWELAEGTPGSVTASGLYVAGDRPGDYDGGLRLKATQRLAR